MNYLRTINVITMSLLLILTGCFGLLDDEVSPPVEGQDTTTANDAYNQEMSILLNHLNMTHNYSINVPPAVTIKTFDWSGTDEEAPLTPSNWEMSGYHFCLDGTLEEGEIPSGLSAQRAMLAEDGMDWHLINEITDNSCLVYFDYLAVDPDRSPGWMDLGIDWDFDGRTDAQIEQGRNSGIAMFAVPNDLDSQVFEFGEIGDCEVFDFAFIASDGYGKTVEFFHTYGGCGEQDTGEDLYLYSFSGEDAQGAPSDGTEDNLIMLTMTQGGDINWATISVKLQIDGAAPVTCDNPGGSGGVCVLEEFGTTTDQVWSVGDGVTIKESGTDLCSSTCTIVVTIVDTNEGRVIDVINDVPAE